MVGDVANPVLYLGQVVDQFGALEFLAFIGKLADWPKKGLLELISAFIKRGGRIGAAFFEGEAIGETGFNRGSRAK